VSPRKALSRLRTSRPSGTSDCRNHRRFSPNRDAFRGTMITLVGTNKYSRHLQITSYDRRFNLWTKEQTRRQRIREMVVLLTLQKPCGSSSTCANRLKRILSCSKISSLEP